MAERRMFAKTIIDSDAFLDMPITSRLLYYDLSMRADDDGFVNSPKKIMRMIGASQDDLSILALRKFIIPFDNGVVVIKHWKIHNYIRKDTYKETPYKEEKALLELDENNSYRLSDGTQILSVDEPSTQDRLGKDRLGKESIDKNIKHKHGEYQNVLLTDKEFEKLKNEYPDINDRIERLSEYIASTGKKYKSHYATVRAWARKEKPEKQEEPKFDWNAYSQKHRGERKEIKEDDFF